MMKDACVLELSQAIQGNKWLDVSGHGNNGVMIGTEFKHSAITFDGIHDYIHLGWNDKFDITGDITIEVLAKPVLGVDMTLVCARGGPTTMKYNFYISSGNRLGFDRYTSNGGVALGTIPITESWQHLTMVLRDTDNRVDFHVNGIIDGVVYSEEYVGGTPTALTVGAISYIGFTNLYKGQIELARIYNIALEEQQVKEMFEQSYRLI